MLTNYRIRHKSSINRAVSLAIVRGHLIFLRGLCGHVGVSIQGGKCNNQVDFACDSDHHADCPIGNMAIKEQIMTIF